MSTTLKQPVLVIRISIDFRVRVIDYLKSTIKGLYVIHEEVFSKKTECLLYFGPTEEALTEKQTAIEPTALNNFLAPAKTWTCKLCTYINEQNERGLMCAMCDSPRSVVEWAGFTKPGQTSQKTQQRISKLVAAFGICVEAAQALASYTGTCRAFETGTVTIVTHIADTWQALLQSVNKEVHIANDQSIDKRVRIRCKRGMQDRLMKDHAKTCLDMNDEDPTPRTYTCLLSPSEFTHVFCAHEVSTTTAEALTGQPTAEQKMKNTVYLYGIVSRKNDFASIAPNNTPGPPKPVICRAYYKIEEAAEASQMMRDCFDSASEDCAVDIGASPGGWTAFLATKFKRVVAVDTGDLHESVSSLDNVSHLRMLLRGPPEENGPVTEQSIRDDKHADCLTKIREACPSIPSFVCCDINQEPLEAVEIVLRTQPFIAPGTIFMITMKLNTRGTAGQLEQVRVAKVLLQQYCTDIEEHWLFNNTIRERTLFARYKGPPATTTASLQNTDVDKSDTLSSTLDALTIHSEASDIVQNSERGLNVVIDCSNQIVTEKNHSQLDRILNECHNYGVSHLHVVGAGEQEYIRQQCATMCKQYMLDYTMHDSEEECLEVLGEAVSFAVAHQDKNVPTLHKTSFVTADSHPIADIAVWLTLDNPSPTIEVRNWNPTFTQFSSPCRGSRSQIGVCSVIAATLSEILRQRSL
eukprot:m.95002 g.95002  ORF g.95002 m.95002 type:complete len:694 (-) comp26779_c0_seq1:183-2264(-)